LQGQVVAIYNVCGRRLLQTAHTGHTYWTSDPVYRVRGLPWDLEAGRAVPADCQYTVRVRGCGSLQFTSSFGGNTSGNAIKRPFSMGRLSATPYELGSDDLSSKHVCMPVRVQSA
jgi:hypothetical protein